MITIADIEAAQVRIAPHVRRTPVFRLGALRNPLPTEAEVTLKLECLQVTGSFKARGAMNRFLGAPAQETARGIVTASGGNHGLAVARTAHTAGLTATIFLPSTVSAVKLEMFKRWNALTTVVGDSWEEANIAALDHARRTKASYFHPFADPLVVAGQGTLGLEILADLDDIDTILVAIGGGGLITGLATAVKARRPHMRILGVEPVGSPTLKACLAAGRLVALAQLTSGVPTMTCRETDSRIFERVSETVDDIILVSDEQMAEAAKWLWLEAGVAADQAGAASIAAIRSAHPALKSSRHTCALVCGAGLDGVA